MTKHGESGPNRSTGCIQGHCVKVISLGCGPPAPPAPPLFSKCFWHEWRKGKGIMPKHFSQSKRNHIVPFTLDIGSERGT